MDLEGKANFEYPFVIDHLPGGLSFDDGQWYE
jgi:hypothetical protein